MQFLRLTYCFAIMMSVFVSDFLSAQTVVTIGTGSSSSSTRGPFQRADTNSSTVFSRWHQIYTAAELSSAGIPSGATISELRWELASSNTIIGSGNANLKIYIKNSSVTSATADTWTNLTTGSTLVLDTDYNTTNNFPGANGWMPFTFNSPFTYTGGAIEISVDWDCSQVTTPAFSGDGAIKWRWESTSPVDLVAKKTASSSAPSNLSDLKDERANIQIVYNAVSCSQPIGLAVNNIDTSSVGVSWGVSTNANSYSWKIVPIGAGSSATAIASGTTTNLMDTATGLTSLTSYDLYVEADCGGIGTSGYAGPFSFMSLPIAQSDVTFGTGSSSSSTRGPFQRSDTNSSTVYSRWNHVYTATELSAAGISTGTVITALNWELASSNVIIGSGDASLKVYIRNSSATAATADTWSNLITGSSLVVDHTYNTVNNFPGANGWMPFNFSTPFTYTGGAIEIAVDWDCSQVTTPAFSGDGSLKWRWESTAPDNLVVKKTSSSSASSNISDLKDERANMQMVYAITTCAAPTGLAVGNISQTSADLSWNPSLASGAYNWKIVLAGAGSGATAVESGSVVDTTDSATGLSAGISYDLYVESDCGGIGTSGFVGPFSFTTLCGNTPPTAITASITDVNCFGESNGAIDISVTAGIPPYLFTWSTSDTTEDISGLTAGLYGVTITDGNGCPYFDSAMVVEPAEILTSTIVSNVSCNGETDGAIDLSVSGGDSSYTYVWSGAETTEDISGVAAGTYSVTVTDGNGCTATTDASVVEPSALALTISSVSDTNSAGVGSASVSVTGGTPPYTYEWDGTTGSDNLTGLTAGSYLVLVTDSNGCTDTASAIVGDIVGLLELDYLTNLTIAPNPTNGLVTVDLELSENANVDISVYAVTGEMVESFQRESVSQVKYPIDLSSYENGLYFVRLSVNEQVTTKRIIFIR